MRRVLRSCAIGLLFATLACPAAAQDAARALKAQGDALMDELRFADAYAVYVQAYALSNDPALLYNEGRSLEAMGEYPEALAKFEEFARTAPPPVRAQVPALEPLIADIKAQISTLVVKSAVDGARLLVRDKVLGVVKGSLSVSVRGGTAPIEVVADGYEPFRATLLLRGGETHTLDAKLTEKRDVAVLRVTGSPANTILAIDEKPLGPLPIEARLAPGTYKLVLRHAGYVEEEVPLTLARGEKRSIDVALHPPPPIYATWWFWTGVGVVVAAGVIVTVALLSEKSPSSGSFSPGTVQTQGLPGLRF